MTHRHRPGMMYRMPYGFGPTAGPRQGPDGERFDWTASPRRQAVAVSFLTDGALLDALLPPGFVLAGEPVVTVEIQRFTELEWLAGRGYNTLGVRFPATFQGTEDRATGAFLAVLWENLPDPILSGRDELGFAKLYAEIPAPRVFRGAEHYEAGWLGHRFMELAATDLTDVPAAAQPAAGLAGPSDGTLHFKYLPRTGSWGEAEVAQACLTPAAGSAARIERVRHGRGRVAFLPATWEQMPTQFHIVNALAALPQLSAPQALLTDSRGAKDLTDQRILR